MRGYRIYRNREGFLVDPDTGEVIEESNIDYEHPEYRLFSYDDVARKVHYSPIEGEYKLRVGNDVLAIGESEALKTLGVRGLIIYRCLVNAGLNANLVINGIKKVSTGAKGYGKVFKYVLALNRSLSRAIKESLIRWNAKVVGDVIDLKYASERLGAPILRGRVSQLIAKINGFKVQITRSKVDISSLTYEHDKVNELVLKLRKLLGIELSQPKPKVATVVIKLPFKLNLNLIARLGGIHQGHRVKVLGDFWSALVFNETINIYVNLKDDLSRIELSILQCLPKVCLAAEI